MGVTVRRRRGARPSASQPRARFHTAKTRRADEGRLTAASRFGPLTRMSILSPTPDTIAEAARHLKAGGLVAFPTETVYGLGADARSDAAVAQIYEVKQRPARNPLIIHVASAAAAEKIAVFDRRAAYLAHRLWPGPLTLVLPLAPNAGLAANALAGLSTVAVRVPDNEVALDLLTAFGGPVAAPSANPSGRLSPTEAAPVDLELGARLAIILDGGPCRVGLESTILDLTVDPAMILRPGGVSRETIEACIGALAEGPAELADAATPKAPGALASHYAPTAQVRLEALAPEGREALLAFGPCSHEGFVDALNLSPKGDVAEAAHNLFAFLRRLDRPGEIDRIAVSPIPHRGLGRAINERLRRAAAVRPTAPAESARLNKEA